MSRLVRFHEFGGPEVLTVDDVPIPAPGEGEVRIRVAAVGLNRTDTYHRAGFYGPAPLPSPLGFEAAGVVEEVGTGVTSFGRGDAVTILPSVRPLAFGTYGDVIVVPEAAVVAQPPELSAVEAAALWVAHLTAYAPLVEMAEVGSGEVVLINAASSSVGLAAMAIVRRLNAVPVALTRTRRKAELLLRSGAEQVIVTDEEDVVERTRALTAGAGARVAFDAVGGPGLTTLLRALARGGIVVQYGLLSREPMLFPLDVSLRGLTIAGYGLNLATDAGRRRRAYNFVKDGVTAGAFRPLIADTFPLSSASEAHTVLERNLHVGKIVLVP